MTLPIITFMRKPHWSAFSRTQTSAAAAFETTRVPNTAAKTGFMVSFFGEICNKKRLWLLFFFDECDTPSYDSRGSQSSDWFRFVLAKLCWTATRCEGSCNPAGSYERRVAGAFGLY